jgi:hypothetical protein
VAKANIEDDTSIAAAARFLRRVPPNRVASGPRPDSSNFEERSAGEGLSVTLWEEQRDLEATISEKPDFGIVCTTAGELREAGYIIARVPLEENPNHSECYGVPSTRKRRQIAVNAKWVKVPSGHNPDGFGQLETLED